MERFGWCFDWYPVVFCLIEITTNYDNTSCNVRAGISSTIAMNATVQVIMNKSSNCEFKSAFEVFTVSLRKCLTVGSHLSYANWWVQEFISSSGDIHTWYHFFLYALADWEFKLCNVWNTSHTPHHENEMKIHTGRLFARSFVRSFAHELTQTNICAERNCKYAVRWKRKSESTKTTVYCRFSSKCKTDTFRMSCYLSLNTIEWAYKCVVCLNCVDNT